jgi:dephospho-CoA kinase
LKRILKTQLSEARLARLRSKKSPLKIGLTGGIGAGKSLALDALRQKRIPVLQTDLLGHQLLRDKTIKSRLVKTFGSGILGRGGLVDRPQLAKAAFQSPLHQKKLNTIMHPAVRQGVTLWIKEQAQQTPVPRFVVVEVPLLFERGYFDFFDGIISISANGLTRQKRLKERGWGMAEIRQREALQWSQERKNQKADWVIYNQSSEKDLKCALYIWITLF